MPKNLTVRVTSRPLFEESSNKMINYFFDPFLTRVYEASWHGTFLQVHLLSKSVSPQGCLLKSKLLLSNFVDFHNLSSQIFGNLFVDKFGFQLLFSTFVKNFCLQLLLNIFVKTFVHNFASLILLTTFINNLPKQFTQAG